jgi:hypothetical protein
MSIRKSTSGDFAAILTIVNGAAQKYKGVIPADCWHEPYMPEDELKKEIAAGVVFSVAEQDGRVVGGLAADDLTSQLPVDGGQLDDSRPSFGRSDHPGDSGSARQIQFAAKFVF